MADDKPVPGPSGYAPEVDAAFQGYYAMLDRAAEARRKAKEPLPCVALGISEQAHWLAQEAREKTTVNLGDVLNQMETEHNRAEKTKRNENLELRVRESFNRKRAPDTARTESYEPQPFNEAAAKALLLSNYPWLDMTHPDSPHRKWSRQVAEHTAQQYDRLLRGGSSAEYFLSGGQGYKRG